MKETPRFSDGSINYGNGVWGPSAVDLQRADLFSSEEPKTKEEPNNDLLFISQESLVGRLLQTVSKVRLPAKFAIPGSVATVLLIGACSGGEKNTQELENKESGYALPFPKGETWFLTGGPHADGLSNGIRYAIDIAPPEEGPCPTDGSRLVIENRVVTASASGEVIVAGDDKNRSDPSHSMVKVKDTNGLTQVYIHLANTQVKKGDKISQGRPLGNPSCEYPPGGRNEGAHVHEGLEKDGQAIPIDGVVIGGWTIHNEPKNYDGTMKKEGEKIRTADTRRCADDKVCGGIRNDLPNNSKEVLGAAATPTANVEKPVEKGWERYNSPNPNLPYRIDYPDPWILSKNDSFAWKLTHETKGKRTTDTFTTWAGTIFSVSRELLDSDVALDNYKDSVVREIEQKFEEKWPRLVQTSTAKKQVTAGENAYNVQFIIQGNPTPHSYVNQFYSTYIFTKDGYGWIVQLEVFRPYQNDTMPVLKKMLGSLTLLPNTGESKVDQSIQAPKSTETPKPTSSKEKQAETNWQQVSSKDIKYTALFPGNFTRQTVKQDGEKIDVIEGKYEGFNARFLIMSFDIGLENPAELLQLQSAILLNTGLGQMMGTFPDTRTLDSININIGGKIQGQAEVILIMDRNGKPALTLIDVFVFKQKRSWLLVMTTDATETSAREKMQNLFQRTAQTFSIE